MLSYCMSLRSAFHGRYNFPIKTMFGSSLTPVVCRRACVLFTLLVSVCNTYCVIFLYCFSSVFSNVYLENTMHCENRRQLATVTNESHSSLSPLIDKLFRTKTFPWILLSKQSICLTVC